MYYRIMFCVSERDNLSSLYKFETEEIEGKIQYKDYTKIELKNKVEDLLNHGISKSDFIIISLIDYNIVTDMN